MADSSENRFAEGASFDCYTDFEESFRVWSANHNIVWVKLNSKTVAAANKKLSEKVPPIPERLKFTCQLLWAVGC